MSKIIGMVCWWYDASLFFPFDSIGNIKRTESLTFIVVNVFEIKKIVPNVMVEMEQYDVRPAGIAAP